MDFNYLIQSLFHWSYSVSFPLAASTPSSTTGCPMDFNYVTRIPWNSSVCNNFQPNTTKTTCCHSVYSVFRTGLAQRLKETSLFQLPDLPTSTSCLHDYHSKLVFLSLRSYQKNRMKQKDDGDEMEIVQEIQRSSAAPQKFRLKELKAATGNFNANNKLGSGGFGTVYKGILREEEVAVKKIVKNTGYRKRDFIAEVTVISNVHHKNLVKLIGWCYESNELLLVYEFMPNGSLDRFIFRNEIADSVVVDNTTLNWETRHNIICGVARALDYLHNGCEKRVIHRDVKASNIMLDSEFNARLGDFVLDRTIQLNEKTHHSTKGIAGTPGYMAPESLLTGKATVETDVYAFGVHILEVVCGRRPGYLIKQNNYDSSIVEWVWEHHRMQKVTDVIDPRLNKKFHEDQACCVLLLGLACCHPNPFERPSMRTASQVLTGAVAAPAVPSEKPAFMWPPATAPVAEMYGSISGGQLSTTMN